MNVNECVTRPAAAKQKRRTRFMTNTNTERVHYFKNSITSNAETSRPTTKPVEDPYSLVDTTRYLRLTFEGVLRHLEAL